MFGGGDEPHPDACYSRQRVLPVPVPHLDRHPQRGWRKPHALGHTRAHLTPAGLLDALSDAGGVWTYMQMRTLRKRLDWMGMDDPLCVPGLLAAAPDADRRQAWALLEAEGDVDAHGLAATAAQRGWTVDDVQEAVQWAQGYRALLDRDALGTVTVTTQGGHDGAA